MGLRERNEMMPETELKKRRLGIFESERLGE